MENPWKQVSSKSPQRENGNRQINNEVWAALTRANLSAGEYKIVMAVIDRTWGFNKTSSQISLGWFSKATGLTRRYCFTITRLLEQKRVVVIKQHERVAGSNYHSGGTTEYLFNKYYDTWISGPELFPLVVDLQVNNLEEEVVAEKSNNLVNSTSTICGTTEQQVIEQPTPDTSLAKETIKETIKETSKEIGRLFETWNSLGIIKHKKLTEKMKTALRAALKDYDAEEIAQSMKTYAEIQKSSSYWFDYRWPLTEFTRRGLEKFLDAEAAKANFRGTRNRSKVTAGSHAGRVPTAAELEAQERRYFAHGR